MWVFGYGSLVWRPAFAHVRAAPARIHGWARRFWQGSTDHRGVPGAPGRVVTLIEAPGAKCGGRAFEVAETDREAVLTRLDHREKGGYERFFVTADLVGVEVTRVQALVYRATESNSNYLGPGPLDAMADQIVSSVGPSGPNTEYLLKLDEALVELGIDDPHVTELAAAVRKRLALFT